MGVDRIPKSKKLLDRYQKEIKYCSFCPKMCRFSCPVAIVSKNETLTPWGKMSLLYLQDKKETIPNNELFSAIYKCTTCLVCQTYCEHKIEVGSVLEYARKQAVLPEGSQIPNENYPSNINKILQHMKVFGNPYGEDLNQKLETLIPATYRNKDSPLLYFPGCVAIKYFPEDIKDTVKILEKLNQDFTVDVKNSLCCGYPSFTLGDEETFNSHMKNALTIFNKYKTIVSNCPMCVKILRKNYPKIRANILHITEYLSLFLHSSAFSNPLKTKKRVIYHDPCYLGRHLQVYEPPRKLLDRFCTFPYLEFFLNKEKSFCCGFGGGMIFSYPLLTKEIAIERTKELKETEAEILVTACPSCKWSFINFANSNLKNIEVKDIVNLIAEGI